MPETADSAFLRETGPRSSRSRARLQVVREVRQVLVAVVGDEDEILEPYAPVALAVEPRLDRDDIAGDEIVVHAAHVRPLVHVEADAVPEPVEEPVLEHFAVVLGALGRIAGGL